MKHKDILDDKIRKIMHSLSCLPRKVLQLHGRDNVTEFILHELGNQDCFNLERAAYVVDNPDFNCLKGIAGYCRPEAYTSEKTIWDEPDSFSEYMKNASYNKKVRCFCESSHLKQGETDTQIVEKIAPILGFKNPSFYAWKMKYDNHGILLYEKADQQKCDCDYLLDGLCFIGFSPVF